MNNNGLRDVFYELMLDIYDAEKQLTLALPRMVKGAAAQDLVLAFQHLLEVTHTHMDHMKQLLKRQGVTVGRKHCRAMQGLIEEGDDAIRSQRDPEARDASLIVAVQKIAHYTIATYGTLRAWASALGEAECARVFQQILDDAYQADNTLTNIADGQLNPQAAQGIPIAAFRHSTLVRSIEGV